MLVLKMRVIVLALFIGYILARREYKKLEDEDKEKVKKQLRNPMALFHVLDQIGYLILFIGIIFHNNALTYVAFLLIGIGWIIDGAEIWKADNKQGLILLLLGSLTFIITSFLALDYLML